MQPLSMDIVVYLREQATRFRELSQFSQDPNIRRQLAALARQCEDLALEIEDGPSYKARSKLSEPR
jgi:hypothetical protein